MRTRSTFYRIVSVGSCVVCVDHDCLTEDCIGDFQKDVKEHLKFHENAKPYVCSELHSLFHDELPTCESFENRHMCDPTCVAEHINSLKRKLAQQGRPSLEPAIRAGSTTTTQKPTEKLYDRLHSPDLYCGELKSNANMKLKACDFSGAYVHDRTADCTNDCLKQLEAVLREHISDHVEQDKRICDELCIELHTEPGDEFCKI